MAQNLNQRIKDLRKGSGLTQLELAKKLDITDKAVSKWESEEGNPDISLLPKLAEIFNVTIDYLLTGKVEEEKVILDDLNDSKRIEYLIKKDDVNNFVKYGYNKIEYLLSLSNRSDDSKGSTIKKSIYKYESVKIFSKLVDGLSDPNLSRYTRNCLSYASLFKAQLDDFVKMCALANRIDILEMICFPIFAVGGEETKDYYSLYDKNTTYQIKEKTLDFIYTDKRISKDVINYVSKMHFYSQDKRCGLDNTKVNFFMNDIIIGKLYEYKKYELLENALDDLNKNIDYSLEVCNGKTRDGYSTYRIVNSIDDYAYCYVENYRDKELVAVIFPIKKAFELAKDNKDLEWLEKFNNYNIRFSKEGYKNTYNVEIPKFYLCSDEMKLVKLMANPNTPKDAILIQKYTTNCVTDLASMLYDLKPTEDDPSLYKKWIDNIKHIKKDLINKIYIDTLEMFQVLLNKNDFKTLFNVATDLDLDYLVDDILLKDKKSILEKVIKKYGSNEDKDVNHIEVCKAKKLKIVTEIQFEAEEKFELLTHQKKNKDFYNKCCKEITKNYIDDLLSKNDLETPIIKLCIRLEATLKHKYQLDGDLLDMIESYLDTLETCDIEGYKWEQERDECDINWTYVDEMTEINNKKETLSENLHKLRKVRNSIVHSGEKVDYTKEDIVNWTYIVIEEI